MNDWDPTTGGGSQCQKRLDLINSNVQRRLLSNILKDCVLALFEKQIFLRSSDLRGLDLTPTFRFLFFSLSISPNYKYEKVLCMKARKRSRSCLRRKTSLASFQPMALVNFFPLWRTENSFHQWGMKITRQRFTLSSCSEVRNGG
jgi:hypothetical protein